MAAWRGVGLPASTEGPDGCVPIHSSAYGASSVGALWFAAYSAATCVLIPAPSTHTVRLRTPSTTTRT